MGKLAKTETMPIGPRKWTFWDLFPSASYGAIIESSRMAVKRG